MIYLSDFLGYIPWMLVHLLQMILSFMYVCRSVCLLTSLPKIDKGISPVLDEISFRNFWRHSWDVGTLVPNSSNLQVLWMRKYLNQLNLKIQFVSWSVWLLIYLLLTYDFRLLPVRGSYSNLFSMFIGLLHMWKIKFLVSLCLLVCMFAYLLNFSVTSAFKFEYLNFIQMHLI